MKKTLCIMHIVLLGLCLALFAGCSSNTAESSSPASEPELTAAGANPMVEKDSAMDIEDELGANVRVPDGATQVKYYVISNRIGQAGFTFQGNEFVARCSKELSGVELHGVNGKPLDGTVSVIIPEGSYNIYTYPEGVRLVTWTSGEVNYSLYTDTSASDDTIASVLETVVVE